MSDDGRNLAAFLVVLTLGVALVRDSLAAAVCFAALLWEWHQVRSSHE